MENASKALLLAGSLLITLIIISMLILMGNSLTSYQELKDSSKEAEELAAFNAQFDAYNRDDVRGNELFSLANKFIDFNRSKTSAGVKESYDIGESQGYETVTLTIEFPQKINGENFTFKWFTYEKKESIRLFDKINNYRLDITASSNNPFPAVLNDVNLLETLYTKDALTKLVNKYSYIYADPTKDSYGNDITGVNKDKIILENKINSLKNFNYIMGRKMLEFDSNNTTSVNNAWDILNGSQSRFGGNGKTYKFEYTSNVYLRYIKDDILRYYEFMQFKSAIFKCTGVTTDESNGTGRITGLTFEFTGNFK